MKKIKLTESVIADKYIRDFNKHTFNINISGDINTGYKLPCLVIIYDTVGHSAMVFMSRDNYSHLVYNKNSGTLQVGETTSATLGVIYADTKGYIHIKNTSELRSINGSYKVIEL